MQNHHIDMTSKHGESSSSGSNQLANTTHFATVETPLGSQKVRFDRPRIRYRVNDISSNKTSKLLGAHHISGSKTDLHCKGQLQLIGPATEVSQARSLDEQVVISLPVTSARKWIVAVHGGAGNNNPDTKYIRVALDR
jgi:hypothetical protein